MNLRHGEGSMAIDRLRTLARKYPLMRALLYPAIVARRAKQRKRSHIRNEVVDSICDLLVDDPVIRVAEFQGVFAVDARSDLFRRIILHREYEPRLVEYCIKHVDPNRDVIDVGANIGFFTVMFAGSINDQRKVLSIEPTKNAIRRLYKNLTLNDAAEKVIVFEGVASDHKGTLEIRTIAGKEEYSSLGPMDHPAVSGNKHQIEAVKSQTVDDLVSSHSLDPGFLKVDVEGSEHLVFDGARNTLDCHRPVVLSELSNFLLKKNSSSSKAVIEIIRRYEYDVIDPVDPSIAPGKKEFGDILCIPHETKIAAECRSP